MNLQTAVSTAANRTSRQRIQFSFSFVAFVAFCEKQKATKGTKRGINGIQRLRSLSFVSSDPSIVVPFCFRFARNCPANNHVVCLMNSFVGDQTFDAARVMFAGNSGSLGVDGGTTLTLGPALVVRGRSASSGRPFCSAGRAVLSTKDRSRGTCPEACYSSDRLSLRTWAQSRRRPQAAPLRSPPIHSLASTGTIQELNGGRVLINP